MKLHILISEAALHTKQSEQKNDDYTKQYIYFIFNMQIITFI